MRPANPRARNIRVIASRPSVTSLDQTPPEGEIGHSTLTVKRQPSHTAPRRNQCRLKNCTALSCFSAAPRVLNVPRFLRLPVFGFTFREYNRYSPDLILLIIAASLLENSRLEPRTVHQQPSVSKSP